MKLVKTIAIITLSVMLTLSLSLNVFIITLLEIKDVDSFKQVLLCRELIDSMSQLDDTTAGESTDKVETPDTEVKVPEAEAPEDAEVIYNENGIKISFVAQELGLMGPSLKFFVENNTDQTLDICLTNIYIDGIQAEYTGMYCNELAAGRKAYETLTLWESDYEGFPSVIEFVVKIQNPETWDTIVETDRMYICLD
jgi:hypothetical protein